MRIGFTGTRRGMTEEQKIAVSALVGRLLDARQPIEAEAHHEAHHGACLGADYDFDFILRQYYPEVRRVSHPPEDPTRTFDWMPAERRPPAPYLKRNRAIVDETELLIATPKGFRAEPRSGTWATVRYAHKKRGRRIYIVMPDGVVEGMDEETAGAHASRSTSNENITARAIFGAAAIKTEIIAGERAALAAHHQKDGLY